ncbi:MAG TPA: DNA-formamidopyrimidine glycosylase family protein [Woeseiaceae bacterium]|nr:DNA-formamidopyrimidine glycosylase family protein [Woeseiaceae bacterium]
MPELPDIDVYVARLGERITGTVLKQVRLASPFLLRTVEPPLAAANGRIVSGSKRIGKRIAIGLEGEYWLVLHLMIAGRLHWHESGTQPPGRNHLAIFEFSSGSMSLTEAGSKKRASLHFVHGDDALAAQDPGGIEPLHCSINEFTARLTSENRTLKRALTDPHKFSGIGNSYSDEILHAARLSPVALTRKLDCTEQQRLYEAMRDVLGTWRDRLLADSAGRFPGKVTAFRDGMAVHGRYGKPCPVCSVAVQRIRYKSNETNYCPRCQTRGKLLADRALSRLLKADWPARIDE